MPKDNRRIHSAIRHGGTLYKDGMEDELAAGVSQKQLGRLAQKGAISGNWASAAPPEPVEDEEVTAAEEEAVEEEVEEEAPKPKRGSKKAAPKK